MNLDSSLSERPKRGTNEAATCRHTANSERGATEESGLRENRTSRLIERTVEGPIGPTTFDSTLGDGRADHRGKGRTEVRSRYRKHCPAMKGRNTQCQPHCWQ